MSMIAPYVGFGNPDDSAQFAYFHVLIQGDEDVYPDWGGGLIQNTRQVANASNAVTQVMGHGPATLVLRIAFEERHQYRLFRTLYGRVATLSLLAGFTSYDGDIAYLLGRAYERFDNTLLIDIAEPVNQIGGGVECTATFQRAGQEIAPW